MGPQHKHVANKLKLPSNSLKSVETLAYKNKFRLFLKKEGFVFPKNRVFKNLGNSKFFDQAKQTSSYDKPVDASGSKGISKIEKLVNLKRKFDNAKNFHDQKNNM